MWVNIAQCAIGEAAQLRQQASDRQTASSGSGQQPDSRIRGVPPQREEPTILRNGCVGKKVAGNQQHEQLQLCARCGEERHVLFMCHRCTRFYCRDLEPPCVDMVSVWLDLPQTPPKPPRWTEHLRGTCIYCISLVQLTNPEDRGESLTVLDTQSDGESDSNSSDSHNKPVV